MREIVDAAAKQIMRILITVFWLALLIGIIVGFYFLDHYRWGGCK